MRVISNRVGLFLEQSSGGSPNKKTPVVLFSLVLVLFGFSGAQLLQLILDCLEILASSSRLHLVKYVTGFTGLQVLPVKWSWGWGDVAKWILHAFYFSGGFL